MLMVGLGTLRNDAFLRSTLNEAKNYLTRVSYEVFGVLYQVVEIGAPSVQ